MNKLYNAAVIAFGGMGCLGIIAAGILGLAVSIGVPLAVGYAALHYAGVL